MDMSVMQSCVLCICVWGGWWYVYAVYGVGVVCICMWVGGVHECVCSMLCGMHMCVTVCVSKCLIVAVIIA